MSKKQKRILIVNHESKQYTMFRVIAEKSAPINHETVIPQVEAFHVSRGNVVLHQVVKSEVIEDASAQPAFKPLRPTPKLAAGPADPPRAVPRKAAQPKKRGRPPVKKNSKPRKLTPDQELLLTRALDAHQHGADGLPEKALNVRVAHNLIRHGLLEAFTPDDKFMSWYRITPQGIERARNIKETWL